MACHDLSRTSDHDLLALHRRLAADRTTMTMEEECRRMSALHAAGLEIERRKLEVPEEPRQP